MLIGQPIPLSFQTPDFDSGVYVKAYLFDDTGTQIGAVNLSSLSNGLYQNTTFAYPASSFVVAQYVVYSDSAYTVRSMEYGAGQDLFTLDPSFQVGSKMPLFYQSFNYDSALYLRANVFDQNNNPVTGSPFNLTAIGANGLYGYTGFLFPSGSVFRAQYVAYDDSGHTEVDPGQSAGLDILRPESVNPIITQPITSNIIGYVGTGICWQAQNGVQDTIVTGSDRALTIRLIRSDNNEPFDLTYATLIEFLIYNEDGTILTVTSNDAGSPITIISAGAGKIQVNLTRSQTALLLTQTPSPFTVQVSGSFGVVNVNFPYQLAVVAPLA